MIYTQTKIDTRLISFLLLAAAAILFIFHTVPANSGLNKLAADSEKLQEEINNLEKELAGEIQSGEKMSEIDKKDLAQAIPEKLEQDVIINTLNILAKTADVSFNAITFSQQQNNEGIKSVLISAGLQGASGNIVRFIQMVETSARKFVVKNASLARSESNVSNPALNIVNLNVSLQAFYRKNE
ncbi:hypothetical protein HZC21_01235 [Candidatus Peregrinibacteria bacterium]|nr:hypothetical protein [Candidatus Peregrinibacteria bacterium]